MDDNTLTESEMRGCLTVMLLMALTMLFIAVGVVVGALFGAAYGWATFLTLSALWLIANAVKAAMDYKKEHQDG